MTCALQSLADHSLVLRACAGAIVGHDLCVRRHESAQGLGILVIDKAYFIAAKIADFFGNWLHIL